MWRDQRLSTQAKMSTMDQVHRSKYYFHRFSDFAYHIRIEAPWFRQGKARRGKDTDTKVSVPPVRPYAAHWGALGVEVRALSWPGSGLAYPQGRIVCDGTRQHFTRIIHPYPVSLQLNFSQSTMRPGRETADARETDTGSVVVLE